MQACGTIPLRSTEDDRLRSVILSEAKDLHILIEKSIRLISLRDRIEEESEQGIG